MPDSMIWWVQRRRVGFKALDAPLELLDMHHQSGYRVTDRVRQQAMLQVRRAARQARLGQSVAEFTEAAAGPEPGD